MKGEQNMTESEKYAEFNALICEAQALSFKADAMKIKNLERKMRCESPIYHEPAFMGLVKEVKKIAEKFRKLGGVK
jgi:hypothetical protein